MNIFNIGIPELLFILVIMLIVMGPEEMAKSARSLARWVRKVSQTPTWRMVRETSQELRELPTQLLREAGLEEWSQQNPPQRSSLPVRGPVPYSPPPQDVSRIQPPGLTADAEAATPAGEAGGKPPAADPSTPTESE